LAWIAYWPIPIALWVFCRGIHSWVRNRGWRVSAFESVLLFLVVVSGAGAVAVANLNTSIGRAVGFDTSDDLWSVTGNSYRFTEKLEKEIPKGTGSIRIVNLYGDVEIRPRDGNQLTLVAEKFIRASSQEEADRLNAAFTFQATQAISIDFPELEVQSRLEDSVRPAPRAWFRSRLKLWVPPDTQIVVVNKWGDVIVDKAFSAVETDIKHGVVRQR
jgi:hypothetical protein